MTSITKTCIGLGIMSGLAAYVMFKDGAICGMASVLAMQKQHGITAAEVLDDFAKDKHFGAKMIVRFANRMGKEC